jgi:hypothetical protein
MCSSGREGRGALGNATARKTVGKRSTHGGARPHTCRLRICVSQRLRLSLRPSLFTCTGGRGLCRWQAWPTGAHRGEGLGTHGTCGRMVGTGQVLRPGPAGPRPALGPSPCRAAPSPRGPRAARGPRPLDPAGQDFDGRRKSSRPAACTFRLRRTRDARPAASTWQICPAAGRHEVRWLGEGFRGDLDGTQDAAEFRV